jgi:polycomb protein EED
MDRRVKIWHIHPRNSKQITREDKPLFSSSRIHRSRVLSVRWVTHDVLMSHCPSAIQRVDPLDYESKDTYTVPGEIVVWKWLGLNRFFPPLYDELRAQGKPQSILRGCASVRGWLLVLQLWCLRRPLHRITRRAVSTHLTRIEFDLTEVDQPRSRC